MRVISQDGTMDVPYEKFIFYIVVDNSIIATKNFGEDHLFNGRVAEYSSRKKAMKAMELLREKYQEYMSVAGGESPFTGRITQPNMWVLPKVFRFPADDEVEA